MSKKMWMVRAGRNAFLVQDFEEKSYVAVGWIKTGDLTNIKTTKELENIFDSDYPDEKPARRRMSLGQLSRFRFEINKDDFIITYNSEFRTYLVGKIISEYQYEIDSPGDYNHILKVNWHGKVNRDDLSTQTKNSLGSIATLFQINETARNEIVSSLEGKPKKPPKTPEAETDIDDLKKETIEKSTEFIKDKIQKLDWDEMQELTAGILRAMGYKTRVSSPGPDRGVDIIASPDGLGLEQPRIRVEVKHRSGSIGSSQLRSFIGGLTQNDRGLYVSTGGFSREARYEAERSSVPITLIDIDELADLLITNYDEADNETKALIPLVKLYWPA